MKRGWNQSAAARFAAQRGLNVLTRNVILRAEKGKTKAPRAEVLRAYAQLYDVPYRVLVEEYTRHQFGIDFVENSDLIRHERDQASDPHTKGASGVPAPGSIEARVQQLEADLKNRERTLDAATRLATDLFNVLISTKDSAPGKGKAGGRRAHRAAG